MNYEGMTDNAIDVEVDKVLSGYDDAARPSFRCNDIAHWGKLLLLKRISFVRFAKAFMVFEMDSNDELGHETIADELGRAVAICFLKIMEAKKSP